MFVYLYFFLIYTDNAKFLLTVQNNEMCVSQSEISDETFLRVTFCGIDFKFHVHEDTFHNKKITEKEIDNGIVKILMGT